MHLTFEEYDKLVRSGMFWEWFPQCTGFYEEDKEELEKVLPMFNNLPTYLIDAYWDKGKFNNFGHEAVYNVKDMTVTISNEDYVRLVTQASLNKESLE